MTVGWPGHENREHENREHENRSNTSML